MHWTVHKRLGSLLILLLLLFASLTAIPHASKSFVSSLSAESFTFLTSGDAHVDSLSPDVNFGRLGEQLKIEKYGSGSDIQQSVVFVKFDFAWFLTSALVLSASMSITAVYSISGLSMNESLLISAYWCRNNGWSEEGITWNNAPWSAVSEHSLDIQRVNTSDSGEFDVTSAAQQALQTGQLTIVLKAEENGTKYFWAREYQEPEYWAAKLDISYIPAGVTDPINIGLEYDSGFLPQLSLWYSWINTGITQVIFVVAGVPELGQFYPSVSFVIQHFFTKNDTEVIIGHLVLVYELFNDSNGNGILDANFINGSIETTYYLSLNMSSGFTPTPIEKVRVNETWHYRWAIHFSNVAGFLLNPNGSAPIGGDTAGILELEYLERGYDYYLLGNTSYLKTSLSLGNVTHFDPINPKASFQNYSLAALHSTVLLTSSRQSEILIGSKAYNSSLTGQPTLPMTNASIQDLNTQFYQLLFNPTYTLFSNPPIQLPAYTSACPSTSLHSHVPQKQLELPVNLLQGFLLAFLPRITPTLTTFTLDYRESGLLYRVSYPQWDGFPIDHDPTYIADISASHPFTLLPPPFSPWLVVIYAVAIFGTIMLLASILELRRLRRIPDERG